MPGELTAQAVQEANHRPMNRQVWFTIGVGVAGALTTILVCFAWLPQEKVASTGTLTISPTTRNARLFTLNYITNRSFDRNQPANKLRVEQGEFRVISSASNTTPNRREVWTLDHDYADVDVTLLIGKPSSLNGNIRSQPGLALRTHINADGSGTALVLDANIWGEYYDSFQINVWSWNAGLSRLKSQGDHGLPMNNRAVQIEGEWRNAGNPAVDTIITNNDFWKNNPNAFKAGDHIDVTSFTDPRYTQVNARITQVYKSLIYVEHHGAKHALPRQTAAGIVEFHGNSSGAPLAALYPRYVRARIVGTKLQAKSWLAEEPEPGWTAAFDLSKINTLARSGQIGLVANHLYGANKYIAFGDLSITPVAMP